MAMETTLRPTTAGATGGTLGPRSNAATQLVATQPAAPTAAPDDASGASASASSSEPVRLRSSGSARIDSALQDNVARAQQARDYLEGVASQLEALKASLSAKLSSARGAARPQLEAQVRQLAQTLQARKKGGGVDGDLNFAPQPARQRFRIRGLDLDTLQQNAPQSLAFSVGSLGGPQTGVEITPDQSKEAIARAIGRALAPMGVHASVDSNGALVFSTEEANWPAVRDGIAVSGRGKVQTEEVPTSPAPQQWDTGNVDALRQSLREVVQALERVRRSQAAASEALSAANLEVARAQTPPPDLDIAADEFANVAANTNYESLLALSSALVGVSRERVLALLGLR
jgi:hypothetical protein